MEKKKEKKVFEMKVFLSQKHEKVKASGERGGGGRGCVEDRKLKKEIEREISLKNILFLV
jgi:hypothetical protein